jgi:Na+-driven multidrug efflux pump
MEAKLVLLVAILWPILLTQIDYKAMNVFNTTMLGWAGTFDIAWVVIGSSLWFPVLVGFNDILLAAVPIWAQ